MQGLREYRSLVALPPLLMIAATLQPLLLRRETGSVRHLAFAVLGWGYLPYVLGHVRLMNRYAPGGMGIPLAVGLGTALSYVGAFVVGKRFDRHKLTLAISPNKIWEGLVGDLLRACLGVGR